MLRVYTGEGRPNKGNIDSNRDQEDTALLQAKCRASRKHGHIITRMRPGGLHAASLGERGRRRPAQARLPTSCLSAWQTQTGVRAGGRGLCQHSRI